MSDPARRISVVIPLFNKEKEIVRAVRSAINQQAKPAEIIVVDDGSTDSGPHVVAEMNEPLVRIEHQPNAGASAARNRGVALAKSDLVAFLDADDEWKPGFLNAALDLHGRFPDAGLWAAGYVMMPRGDMQSELPQFPDAPTAQEGGLIGNLFACCLKGNCPLCASSVVCGKSVLESIGGFPEGVSIGEDWDVWFKIALKHKIAYSPSVEVIYHLDADSRAMTRYAGERKERCWTAALTSALAGGGLAAEIRRSIERLLCQHYVLLARDMILEGDGSGARLFLAKARFFALSDAWVQRERYPSLAEFERCRMAHRGKTNHLDVTRIHWIRLWVRSFLGKGINGDLAALKRFERRLAGKNDAD